MDAGLGLNALHEGQVAEFLQFSKGKRSQCVRVVQAAFESAMEARLTEETFTSEEVRELVEGISGVVLADVEEELMASSHVTAALLQQLLQKAEESFLSLTLTHDITQLESKDTLENIAKYERMLNSSGGALPHSLSQRTCLEPLQVAGREKLLQEEVTRLRSENSKLVQRIKVFETEATSALSSKDKLLSKRSEVQSDPQSSEQVNALRKELAALQVQLETIKKEGEAPKPTEELLQVRAELERAKNELQKKFQDTVQYENMKKMLETKTKQLKELRAQLQKSAS